MPSKKDRELVRLATGGAAGRTVVEVLLETRDAIAPANGRGFNEAVSQLAAQLEQLRSVSQVQSETVAENTQAVMENTVAQASGQSRAASAAGGIAKRIFGSALGLMPLAAGIVSLFRSTPEPPPPLAVYTRPPGLAFEGAVSRSAAWSGVARQPVEEARERRAETMTVNVNVQAMDSRSFLDHRGEIARAVREAMLNSHSVNDVVNEL